MKMKKFSIKQTTAKDNDMQLAFLEGVLMPNGEFIANGDCRFLKDNDIVYLVDEKKCN